MVTVFCLFWFLKCSACRALGDEKEKGIETAVSPWNFLRSSLKGRNYFGGEQIGYLDLAFGWIHHWLNVIEEVGCMKLVDAQRFPLLHQWAEDFIGTPLIKECLPPRDKVVEYFTASINYLRSLAASQQ